MEYRSATPEDYEAVRQFLCEAGWRRRVSDPARFRLLMENTDRAVIACDGARIVGFARALCDGVSNGYVSMVAVAADRQKEGIVRELVRRLIGEDREITWVLRAGRGSGSFWEKVGFRKSEVAMEKVRDSSGG